MKPTIVMIFLLAQALSGVALADQKYSKTFNVYIDLGPNRFTDPAVLKRVSDLLVSQASALELGLGDQVKISSIGGTYAEKLSATDFNREFKFTYRGNDPRDLPRGMAAQIAQIPSEPVQSGPGGLQAFTAEADLDCMAGHVETVVVMNGAESLTLSGDDANYIDLPNASLCGTLTFVGWWTREHNDAWPGMRQQVQAFTKGLLMEMGADDVRFLR